MILSKEELLELDPDILIMGNWNQGGAYHDSETQLAEMNEDPAYHSLRALQNGNVIIIPQRNVNCLSHHIADGIEAVFQAVYPDIAKEQ